MKKKKTWYETYGNNPKRRAYMKNYMAMRRLQAKINKKKHAKYNNRSTNVNKQHSSK